MIMGIVELKHTVSNVPPSSMAKSLFTPFQARLPTQITVP
jgi:hypothetical protein